MPGKIKVKILAGRNLPVMDRSGDTTDAYVEIKFGNTTFKTDVCRKSLNPQWNSEWYRFEVDDAELQDEPLQVRLMDHDTYSANDAIGKVYVNLNPLLLPGLPPTVKNIWTLEATMNSSSGSQGGSVMTGWIPVFDTMHGIRGEVNIIVKVELFSDCNKFRQSSCGVQFFYSPNIPHGYHAQVIHGFVEELVVSDDPEYKWIDKIRTPRASNEARQTLFFKLSGEVQRKIGLKALDLGGNAVIGYVQNFDLEGESGIVARGIGTAVTLVKLQDISSTIPLETSNIEDLTCFDLQSKNNPDFSESDDSLPLITNSPKNQSPIISNSSTNNLQATTISPSFPKYEKTRKYPRQGVRVAEYRAGSLRSRQLSLQNNSPNLNNSIGKNSGSTLSLSDDLMSESSFKNMLALEDMRGEPVGNPFSRGLKNFRYLHQNILPRRVAIIKSKISDSLDDESDQDSTYSSTWSLAGSESNRSPSLVDLRQSIRRKKFTHKKSTNDGIAALLIRSVHSGFPLDSVREDRETPTPSPVNFFDDFNDYNDDTKRRGIFGKKDLEGNGKLDNPEIDDDFVENQLLLGSNQHEVKYKAKELLIPMISSSETDTSTSDDDEEPSESSTNYNILDDSFSVVDGNSNDDGIYQTKSRDDSMKNLKGFEDFETFEEEKRESVGVGCEMDESHDGNRKLRADYNIIDDTFGIAGESKINENSPKNEKLLRFESNDHKNIGGNYSTALESDFELKSSHDFNIIDQSKSIIEENKLDEKKIDENARQDEKSLKTQSNDDKNIEVDHENKGKYSTALESDFGLKFSHDFDIIDESKSIIGENKIDAKKVDELFDIDAEIPKLSAKPKNITIDTKNEVNSEKPKSINEKNMEISVPIDAVELLEIANKLEDVVEKMKISKISSFSQENLASGSRNDDSENIYQHVDAFEKNNYDDNSKGNIQITYLLKDSPEFSSNLSSNLESFENSKNPEIDEKKQSKNESSITLRDCHSTSSTNYNFLDESSSPNENSSVDDGKYIQSLEKEIKKSFEIENGTKIELSISEKIEKIKDTEETTNESECEENIAFSAQNDSKLESSTDYNILDDVSSLTEINSFDDEEKCEQNFYRSFDTEEVTEIPSAFISSLVSFQDFQNKSINRCDKNREMKNVKAEENPSSLTEKTQENLSNSPTIFPNPDTKLKVNFTDKSISSLPESSPTTTPTKLKHLKFLPKQKHFDSSEDFGFVTSTPVETEVTLFADFEKTDKSFESEKLNFPPVVSSSPSESKSPQKNEPEKILRAESLKITSEKRIQQICPLGVSFDTIRLLNYSKSSPISSSTKEKKIDKTNPISESSIKEIPQKKEFPITESKIVAVKKEKPVKKIERTDTVIYKGPPKDREKFFASNRDAKTVKNQLNTTRCSSPIPIFVAPPPEENTSRLQVPVIKTTNINVQSTFSPDEMKTQHFGSIGSRKFPLDELAISEKFNRKYRQHCILDLIKTIDAKMMIHHSHHDRRDSTKSKRKKRINDRINTSATPSPDSIHRMNHHSHNHNKIRSRSRSPDHQHHGKFQISSLSTHSFPSNSTHKNSSSNFNQDSTSCYSSSENLTKNIPSTPVLCQKESNIISQNETNFLGKENTNLQVNNDNNSLKIRVFDVESPIENLDNQSMENNEVENNVEMKKFTNSIVSKLDPKELEHPVCKSHSTGNLEGFTKKCNFITNNTNATNTIDDLCVPCSQLTIRQQDEQQIDASSPTQTALPSSLGTKVTPNSSSTGTKTNTAIPNMHRRSSDSDLSITPKGNSLAGSDRSMGGHMRPSTAIVRTMNQDTMEMLEYPFITMQQYPPGFVLNIGGLVSARSVKLLERITNLEEPEGRDAWWTEIRMEVRSHARALACNVVLGYKEEISICDDVCVLNASGTAAVINLLNASQDQDNVMLSRTLMTTSIESEREKVQIKTLGGKMDKSDDTSLSGQQTQNSGKVKRTSESNDHEVPYLPTLSACSLCHLPYSESSVPFRVDVSKCAICRRAKVPDVLFTTIELPENIPMTGRGVFLQATVCKSKRDLRGELNAKEISDCLPFLEYELHSLLLNKLKVKGMNAIFGLKVQVSVGERLVIGMAVGTAVFLTALPTPSVPQIASGNSWHNEEQLAEIQKNLIETVKKNREFYRLKPIADIENGRSITTSDTDESDDDLPDLDLGIGTKDACVLEVDDVEDMDRINLLIDEKPPDDFHVVNTQSIPGLEDLEIVRNLQMFTQISRAKIPAGQFASMPSKYFARMLQTVLFKLRRMVPCALCDMQFKVALPEQDEIQLSVVGMALGLGEPTRFSKYKRKIIPNSTSKDPIKKTDDNDMIFSLDEDQADVTASQDSNNPANQSNTNISTSSPLPGLSAQKHRPRSPFRTKTHRHKHVPLKERYGVDITPLSYLPGGKIERYLGNLNFFFIRESTSIRENGGLSGFTHSFVTEILAIVRAHITALGGNAMVSFFMTQCVLLHSPHKNQGQCLINVGGDVVTVSYYGDDKYQGNQNC